MARLVRTVTPHGNYCTCIRRNSASSSVEQTLSYFLYYHYSLCFHAPDSLALSALHCICRNCDLVQAHILIWQDHVFFSSACFVSSAFKSLSEACKFHYSAHLQHGFFIFPLPTRVLGVYSVSFGLVVCFMAAICTHIFWRRCVMPCTRT